MANNSMFALEAARSEPEDITAARRELEAKNVRILEALSGLHANEHYRSLKTELLDGLTERLERDLKEEAEKNDPNPNRLNRITGELKWARKFSDLSRLENDYRGQLTALRKHLHG